MTRITSWPIRARLAVSGLCFCLVMGCLSNNTRDAPGRLVVSPTTGYQMDVLALTLSSEDVDLSACTSGTLSFVGEDGATPIKVHRQDALLHDAGGIRAYIEIGSTATPGDYDVALQCTPTTTLHGMFRVSAVPPEIELTVAPTTAQAGSFNRELTLTTNYSFFDENTEVHFGNGKNIETMSQKLISATELDLTVIIDTLTPTGAMPIAAVSGDRVARGELIISDRIKSEISVSPSEVTRTAESAARIASYELSIEGNGMSFVVSDTPDAGAEDDLSTRVSFPEEPHIKVIDTRLETYIDQSGPTNEERERLIATILVDKLAKLGGTTLQVANGSDVAWTNLTVLLPQGTPYLKVANQLPLSRDGKPTLVFAEAINFTFESGAAVTCEEAGCEVLNFTVGNDSYKTMNVEVTIDPAFEPNVATLTAENGDGVSASALLNIDTAEVVTLEPNPNESETLIQGADETLLFHLSNGAAFNQAATTIHVLPRSGLRITDDPAFNGFATTLYVFLEVAEDAPTGPAYLRVESGSDVYEAPLLIGPSGDVPSVSLFPGATIKRRDDVLIDIRGEGLTLPTDVSQYRFDDPGILVQRADPTDDGAALTIRATPGARTDMSVLYVNGEDGKAAGTFRVLNTVPMKVLRPDNEIINRGQNTTLLVSDPDIAFEKPTVEVMDDIGIRVEHTSGGKNLAFDVNADETGPLGWTGLIVRDQGESYLLRVYIEDDQANEYTLSARLTPEAVFPGTRITEVTALLPPQFVLEPATLRVQSGVPGVYASNPRIIENIVFFYLDVPLDADPTQSPVPFFITGARGAAVGLIDIDELVADDVDEETPWTGNPSDQKALLSIDSKQMPTLISGTMGRSDRAEPGLRLIAGGDNQLDVSDMGESGQIWIVDEDRENAVVEVTSTDSTRPVEVAVRARGRNAVREADEDAETSYAWESDNPCDTPLFGTGEIDDGLDTDRILLNGRDCRLVAIVLARSLANRPWDTPDLIIEHRNAAEDLLGENHGWPTLLDPDPRLFLEPSEIPSELILRPELSTAGSYAIHIRRSTVLREISREPNNNFIELETVPGISLDTLTLELRDADGGTTLETLPLAGTDIENNGGIALVSGTDHAVAVFPDSGAFAVLLYDGTEVIDAVQVGEGSFSYGEGNPVLPTNDAPVFYRVAGIDTNDNMEDFKAAYVSTPGR